MSDTRLVVLSGMSGSGKTSALRCFEDLEYYCVDNLPPPLIPTFVELCARATPRMGRVALVVDARTRDFLEQFVPVWDHVLERLPGAQLLFFDAEDATLVQRFSETRRPHPMGARSSVRDGITAERSLLADLRERADAVIDTTHFNVRSLREFILDRFQPGPRQGLNVAVASFAYRHGLLDNADLVFDVRFLPNPHYEPALRPLTGLDTAVREFVESRPETHEFLEHTDRLLQFLLPQYAEEGKTYLTLAFGCTGGRHRSVAIAEMVAERLRAAHYPTTVTHADLGGSTSRQSAAR